MSACNVSMTDLTKAYSEKLPRGEKKNARGQIEERLETSGVIPPEEARDRSPYLRKSS